MIGDNYIIIFILIRNILWWLLSIAYTKHISNYSSLNKQLKTTQLTIVHTIKLNKQLKTTQLTIIHTIKLKKQDKTTQLTIMHTIKLNKQHN